MPEDKLKVVVIDDDEARKNKIRDILPDYLNVVVTGYGRSAQENIMPDSNGKSCNLVIMNADDNKGQAICIFDWMNKNEERVGLDRIPVLLLVEDEFSDRALSFLEIADAQMYEGDIDPDDFFLTVTSILNEAEFLPEPDDTPPAYTEKSSDRINGLSVKPEGETEDTIKRSAVFNDSEQLAHLDEALERGRKKQRLINEIMQAAVELKEEKTEKTEKPEIQKGNDPVHKMTAASVSRIFEEDDEADDFAGVKTVVIIDADVSNLKLCEAVLQRKYNVVLLNSGMSAIDYFVKKTADMILISFSMPLIDGVRILDSIRWQPNGKNIPAVFMAEGNIEMIKPMCRREHVVGIIQKPISMMALKQAVDTVFMGKL